MKTRKIMSIVLALVIIAGLAVPALSLEYGQEYTGYPTEGTQQYSDVPTTHWAYSSIDTCSQRAWFNGYPDKTFRPNAYIRRDEAAKVFAVALGLTLEENPTITYTDTADSWAKAHIEATKALFPNVANLQGTSSFRPSQIITREETVYALLVAWRYASKTVNADLSVLNMFSDADSISAGVKPYMAVAVSEKLVSGFPGGTIAAQKGLTRAEFATLLARALNHGYGSDTTDIPAISVNKYSTETTEATLTITGRVSPVSTGTKLTLDGESVALDSNGSFRATVDLELGENIFTLETKNTYGVRDVKVIHVTRVELEPEPSAEPSQQPQPSQQPEPSQQPQPSQEPSKDPGQTQDPEPTKQPEPSKEPEPDPSGLVIDPNREVLKTGKCGTNMKFVLYADGELVIAGKGRMENFELRQAPWYSNQDQIMSVTICDGVTSVGTYAFTLCSVLTEVALPNGITSIGAHAFECCSSLRKLPLPDSVNEIGDNAFYSTGLVRFSIPSGVTIIGDGTFKFCDKLTRLTIPASVTDIGDSWPCNGLQIIYYGGSPLQWTDISIRGNWISSLVEIRYNSTGE